MTIENLIDCSEFDIMVDDFSVILLESQKRDVNGTLITQGDIVEIIYNYQPEGFGKFEVIHEKSALRLRELERNWALIVEKDNCLEDFEEMKIIGTIFEKIVDDSTIL